MATFKSIQVAFDKEDAALNKLIDTIALYTKQAKDLDERTSRYRHHSIVTTN